jgi:hypothetical protein
MDHSQTVAEKVVGRFLIREVRSAAALSLATFGDVDVLVCLQGAEDRSINVFEQIAVRSRFVCCALFAQTGVPYATSDRFVAACASISERKLAWKLPLGPSVEYFENIDLLVKRIGALVARIKSDVVNVVLDISSLPKAYITSVLGYLYKINRSIRVRALYSEAEYGSELRNPSAIPAVTADVSDFPLSPLGRFTDGAWRLINLAHMRPALEAREGRKVVAFCGGDEDRLISALQQYDGAERAVVVAASKSPDSIEAADRRKASLCEFTPLDEGAVTMSHPHKVLDALELLEQICVTTKGTRSAFIMPFSTKPHALAAAIFVLANEDVSVVARIPGAYLLRQATRTNRIWIYEIIDLSSPHMGRYL